MNVLVLVVISVIALFLGGKLLTHVFQWLSHTMGMLADLFPRLVIIIAIIIVILIFFKGGFKNPGFTSDPQPTRTERLNERYHF